MTRLLNRPYLPAVWLLLFYILFSTRLVAQQDSNVVRHSVDTSQLPPSDTAAPAKDSFFLLKSRGLLGRLAQTIIRDTIAPDSSNLQRLDLLYAPYTGRIIRHIEIRRVDFGVPINDTSRSFKNTLTNWADALHHTTRENVIRNNLFFRENDTLLPILLADNERHLRDQTYLGDARIIVRKVMGTRDSVDVVVLTKDVLSIGGRFRMGSLTRFETALREDNFDGSGDKFEVKMLYDQQRARHFGFGSEYVVRNVGGSFADVYIGAQNFAPTFNSMHRQETTIYASVIRPLVNPYMKWTYALDAGWHKNNNMYFTDSFYNAENRYKYYNVDAWGGLNISARKLDGSIRDDRLRTLVGLRFIHQAFQQVPEKYEREYYFRYANLTGVLASISLFKQTFYKTQYVYGLGRYEDVPEGLDVSVTTGWTNKQQRVRPYTGLNLQFNYFTPKKHYFNYGLRLGGYTYHKRYEDISILGSLEFFSRLKQLSAKWKQRTFVTASITTQLKKQLAEPLFLESQYGLNEYENINLAGDHRLTVRAESVFYNSKWSLLAFKFAPFVFGNASLLTPPDAPLTKTKLYNTIGAGIRSRNESLVFGTLELRTFYFPGRNFNGDRFRVEFNTGIRFKYNNQFIRRPDFIVVN